MSFRPRRLLRVFSILGLSAALTLLVAEGGYRGLLALRGNPHDAGEKRNAYYGNLEWLARPTGTVPTAPTKEDATAKEDGEAIDPLASVANLATSVNVLSPYLGVEVASYLERYARDGHYFGTPAADAAFDVLIMGGSVAAILSRDGQDAMVAALNADTRLAGRKVRVWNQARGGFKAPQTSILMGLLFQLGWKPDAVVLVDGFNELALGNVNRVAGASPLYPSLSHWAHLAGGAFETQPDPDALVDLYAARRSTRRVLKGALKFGLYRSALASKLVDVWLTRPRARASRALRTIEESRSRGGLPIAMRGPSPPASLEATLSAVDRMWIESSVSLEAMCRVRGVPYLHVLQPTLYDEGAKPITPNELQLGKIDPEWKEGVVAGYPILRASLQELESRGVRTFDASMIFSDWEDDLYYDCCHFTAAGSELLGRQIVERLLENEAIGR